MRTRFRSRAKERHFLGGVAESSLDDVVVLGQTFPLRKENTFLW